MKKQINYFNLGDEVTWFSMGGQNNTGKVVHVLQENDIPHSVAGRLFPGHQRMFDGNQITPGGGGFAYLVEVRTTEKAMPKLYMPYPSKLRKVNDQGEKS